MNIPTATAVRPSFWLPVWTLAVRELVRFFRQRTRVIGALGQPIIFWILFGAGLQGSFKAPGWAPPQMEYQEYFFPGITVLIVLFTAIFSTISIIEDRREGFLQGVLVSPASRTSLVLGKLCGGAALAILQASLFLFVGPLLTWTGLMPTMEYEISPGRWLGAVAFLSVLAFALTGLGYLIAWPMDSTQGYHAVMSVVLFPMWLLSGAFFPASDSGWLSIVIRLNPLTYGVAGMRRLMDSRLDAGAAGLPSLSVCLAVTALFCAATVGLSIYLTGRQASRDTR